MSSPNYPYNFQKVNLPLFCEASPPHSRPKIASLPSIMNVPTKIAGRYPLLLLSSAALLPSSSLRPRGLRRLGLVPIVRSWRLKPGVEQKMAWSLEKVDAAGVEISQLGVVRPATEAHTEEAVEALRAGKVIAVPTDTLYGFACDACSLEAVPRIYEIKGRNHTSPLTICVGDVPDIQRFTVTDHSPHGLLESLLPGPVTLVLRRGLQLIDEVYN